MWCVIFPIQVLFDLKVDFLFQTIGNQFENSNSSFFLHLVALAVHKLHLWLHIDNTSTHLHKFNHVRVIKLLEDGYLLVNTLQRPFGLRGALRGQFYPTRRRSACLNHTRGNHVKGWCIGHSSRWWNCPQPHTHTHTLTHTLNHKPRWALHLL